MHPQAEALAAQFIKDFWAADHEIRWGTIESEFAINLDARTILVGKRDADGLTPDGRPFFADWKTASKNKARYKDAEKRKWRMNPQALTYGVATEALNPGVREFMVRWAFKTDPITTDFEWYSYTSSEIEWWREELLRVGSEIREQRRHNGVGAANWPLTLTHCDRYGENYRCQYRDEGCWKRDFNFVPLNMIARSTSHIALENDIKKDDSIVVLDATRVGDYLSCRELYRKNWEAGGLTEESEALVIGSDFHSIIAAHLETIRAAQGQNKT